MVVPHPHGGLNRRAQFGSREKRKHNEHDPFRPLQANPYMNAMQANGSSPLADDERLRADLN